MNTKELISRLRELIGQCTAPKREMYEALLDEAEGWQLMLDDLSD